MLQYVYKERNPLIQQNADEQKMTFIRRRTLQAFIAVRLCRFVMKFVPLLKRGGEFSSHECELVSKCNPFVRSMVVVTSELL